jgi:biopolymer transport protein TolQ
METPLFAMIAHSGWIAKTVLLILLLFSILTWAIIINRLHYLRNASKGDQAFKSRYGMMEKLSGMEDSDGNRTAGPLAQLYATAAEESRRIMDGLPSSETCRDPKKSLPFFLQNQFAIASERLECARISAVSQFDRGVFLLAMVSSISPFLGLLGTVWGIMHSFYEIGSQGSASLPVVAPGIAEALVATLAGLAVAIPALFFYNYFNHHIERIETVTDEFKGALLIRLKRETLDDRHTKKR